MPPPIQFEEVDQDPAGEPDEDQAAQTDQAVRVDRAFHTDQAVQTDQIDQSEPTDNCNTENQAERIALVRDAHALLDSSTLSKERWISMRNRINNLDDGDDELWGVMGDFIRASLRKML